MPKRSKFQIRSDAARQRWHVRDEQKEAFWRGHKEGWKKSGLSKRAYCSAHDLTYSSFMSWQREVEIRDREKVPPANAAALLSKSTEKASGPFVPVRLVSERLSDEKTQESKVKSDAVRQQIDILVPGGAVIRLNATCSAPFIAELFFALKTEVSRC
jgi:hypothetical protein